MPVFRQETTISICVVRVVIETVYFLMKKSFISLYVEDYGSHWNNI